MNSIPWRDGSFDLIHTVDDGAVPVFHQSHDFGPVEGQRPGNAGHGFHVSLEFADVHNGQARLQGGQHFLHGRHPSTRTASSGYSVLKP